MTDRRAQVCVTAVIGMIGLWFVSCTADAAPKNMRSVFVVSARVVEVDCTMDVVKKKACAPTMVTRGRLSEDPKVVVETVLFY